MNTAEKNNLVFLKASKCYMNQFQIKPVNAGNKARWESSSHFFIGK